MKESIKPKTSSMEKFDGLVYLDTEQGKEALAIMRNHIVQQFMEKGDTISAGVSLAAPIIETENIVWKMMALFDELVELGELKETTLKYAIKGGWHRRTFIKGENWQKVSKN